MERRTRWGLVAAGALGGYALAKHLLRRHRSFDWEGKRVVVAGGSRGLGLVLARQLVDAGARVAICARNKRQLIKASDELADRGGEVVAQKCDVSEARQSQSFLRTVRKEWGGVDVLINVAGIMQVGPFDSMTDEDFRRAMDVNCWGHLNMIRACLPDMREQGWGRIVNIASLGGKRAVPHMLAYDASKFALVGLSGGLRTELAQDGILVTTVCPGLMRTGSPRNATFKGRHRSEYAWFSIGDALPMVSMSAETAARKIMLACQHGDPEVMLVGAGNVASLLSTLAPNLTMEILSLVNRMLPQMGGIGRRSAKGHESESSWSPSLLTRLGDQAARRNNEFLDGRN